MTTVQTPKNDIRKTAGAGGTSAPSSGLSKLFDRQRDAVEAARLKGVQEVEVCFRIPGAEFVAHIKIEDLEQLFSPWTIKNSQDKSELVPTVKLRLAVKEAADVRVFYKTPQELFDALEKQD